MLGIVFTLWSTIRSSRIAQGILLIGIVLGVIFFYGFMKEKKGFAKAMTLSIKAANKRMERNREIHREIKQLPLSVRADRLRELNTTR